jgi:hypothetical protein
MPRFKSLAIVPKVIVSPMGEEANVTVKVALVGRSMVGRPAVMAKSCKGSFTEDCIASLGLQFLERQISP